MHFLCTLLYIILEANPIRSHELLKYGQLIRFAALRYYGYGWRDYDVEFRHRMHRRGGFWALIYMLVPSLRALRKIYNIWNGVIPFQL